MRQVPESLVCALGHLATTDEILGRGFSADSIRASIRTGILRRVSRGFYACGHADSDQLDAARAHARLTSVSALRRAGVWTGLDRGLHLQLLPHASATGRPAFALGGARIHYHWALPRFTSEDERSWIVAPMEAVWQAIHCLDEENAIACLESAVRENFLTIAQVRRICKVAPKRLAQGIAEMEFTSDSGQETIARRRVRHAGYRVEAQVAIQGLPYREDLVVEDCVAIETDGKKWHGPNRFHADRNRDLHLAALGRPTLRITERAIMHEWETTFAAIERAVADARYVRSRLARGIRQRDGEWDRPT